MNFFITFFASFLIWFLFLALGILWIVDGKIKKEQVLHALFSVVMVWLISRLIKVFIPIPRPFLVNGHGVLTLIGNQDGSFPSFHTAAAFAISTTIYLHDRRVGIAFFVASVAIGIARIAANVHYPVDILGGALIGTLTALFFDRAHPKVRF